MSERIGREVSDAGRYRCLMLCRMGRRTIRMTGRREMCESGPLVRRCSFGACGASSARWRRRQGRHRWRSSRRLPARVRGSPLRRTQVAFLLPSDHRCPVRFTLIPTEGSLQTMRIAVPLADGSRLSRALNDDATLRASHSVVPPSGCPRRYTRSKGSRGWRRLGNPGVDGQRDGWCRRGDLDRLCRCCAKRSWVSGADRVLPVRLVEPEAAWGAVRVWAWTRCR